MAQQSQEAGTREPEVSRREARAHRILDAASTLILRWGYHKTTIDDIAREAGVGKGTLYLHWKTREELFAALIKREKVEMAEEIKQRIERDPAGATLRGLLKHSTLALLKRPLMKAVLLRDMDVLGKLARSEHSSAAYAEQLTGFTTYLQLLREQGLVRSDLSMQAQVYTLSAIFAGFFLVAPLLPDEFMLSDEELAELLAETVHCALEPSRAVPSAALQTASHAFTQYLDRSMAVAQEQFQTGALAEFERDLLREPTNAGLAARARGRKGGRQKKLKTGAKVAQARHMYADKTNSIEEICSTLGISRASLYRYVKDTREGES